MEKIFDFLIIYMLAPLNKLSNTKIVRAIMNASLAAVPFTIVASIFLILNNLPEIFPFAAVFFKNTILKYSSFYILGNTMALGSLSLYYSLSVGYYYVEEYQKNGEENLNSFSGALLSMFAFLMTIPSITWSNGAAVGLSKTVDKNNQVISGISMVNGWISRFSGVGIFISIVTGVIAVQIYRICVTKNITIKMPQGVPEGVSRSFASLVPAILVSFAMISINIILSLMGTDMHGLLSAPFGFVKNLTGSWLGMLVILILIHLLWVVGVHGTAIIKNSFINPILLVALSENLNGHHNIFAGDFINMWVFIGGAGGTLGLVLLMAFVSKSDQLKTLGKTALFPAIFNINEPVIFGAPIVYNPYLILPFIINPMVLASVAYFSIKFHLVSYVNTSIAWIMPVGVGAWFGTSGNFPAAILAFINLGISILIYYPFFKLYDNKLLKDERKNKG